MILGSCMDGACPACGSLSQSTRVTQEPGAQVTGLGASREPQGAVLCCWEGAGFEVAPTWAVCMAGISSVLPHGDRSVLSGQT